MTRTFSRLSDDIFSYANGKGIGIVKDAFNFQFQNLIFYHNSTQNYLTRFAWVDDFFYLKN